MDQNQKLLLEVTERRKALEKESLLLFTPQPQQAPIFVSKASRLLIRGGNQSGKTLCGAVQEADAVCGGERWGTVKTSKNLKLLCVSLDFSLMSENIYRKMFEPGAFDICSLCQQVRHVCEDTGVCSIDGSTWNDRATEAEPLIPERLVRDIAWLDKRRGIPSRARLATGAVIDFRSTDQGRAKFQGPQWDRVWCDEEATNDEEIMNEIRRGLIKRAGCMKITATPLAASLTMVTWSEKAGEEKARRALEPTDEPPEYEEVRLFTDENRALGKKEIEHFFSEMGEEEENVRRRGEFLVQQGLVYGREFQKDVHLIDTFQIPLEWTVYEIQDPGHAVAFATLYWAVDPEGDNYLIDELYLRRADLPDVVRAQKKLLAGGSPAISTHCVPQRSIIDPASAQVAAGMKGQSVRTQLHAEREKQRHLCYEGGPKTYKAHNEVRAGIFAVKALLRPRESGEREGKPRLFVMRHLKHWLRESRRYRWPRPATGKDLVEKAGPIKKDDHLMDCTRYGALARFQYKSPEFRPGWGANPRLRKAIQKFRSRQRKKRMAKQKKGFNCLSS